MAPSLVYGLCSMLWSMVLRLETIQQWCLLYSPVTSLSRSSNSMLHIKSNDLYFFLADELSLGTCFWIFFRLGEGLPPGYPLVVWWLPQEERKPKEGREKRGTKSLEWKENERGDIWDLRRPFTPKSFIRRSLEDWLPPTIPSLPPNG